VIDSFLWHLDVGPMGALWRTALGAAFAYALSRVLPNAGGWTAVACLAGTLLALKAAAAGGRRFVRSPRARDEWVWRRMLASDYDSYQWRKLLWVGLGILVARSIAGTSSAWEIPVGLGCVASGAVGELAWRRMGVVRPSARS
jgi:hypothetical protein